MEKSSVSTKKTRFNFDAFCSSPASTLFFPLVIIIRADAKTLQHDRDLPTCSAGRGVCQPDHKLTSCWSLLANTERLCGLWLASPRPHGGSTLNVTVRLRNLQEGILSRAPSVSWEIIRYAYPKSSYMRNSHFNKPTRL